MKSAGVPRLARKIFGRAPDALSFVVRLVAQRLERRGEPDRRQGIELELRLAIGRQHHRPGVEHGDVSLVQVREFAGAGQHVASFGDVRLAHGPGRGDLVLDQVLFERRKNAAGLLDLLEQRPGGFAQLLRQRFDAAGAGRGIGHLGEVGFFEQHQLGVARGAARERIGQSQRQRVRQHGDGVGAAEAGGEGRHRRAQHVHVGVALRQHAPRGIGGDEQRLRRQAAGLFDPRPQQPQRAEFGQRQELIGIGGQPRIDHALRIFERDTRLLDRAQIGRRRRPARRPVPAPRIRRRHGSPVHRRRRTGP